jgi:protoheme IX farnesyltransferase
MVRWIKILSELTKFRISCLSTFSAFVGFVLAHRNFSGEMISPLLGVFLLASGSCALNQYQERENDRWMKRTQGRPIPSKRLSPSNALKISLSLLGLGSFILYFGAKWSALGLGLFAVFWYNGVYTYLKRKTSFAAIPGALIGSIPPVIGWISGKGHPVFDPQILVLSFFFFIWQVPHFWLLLLNFEKDYETSRFPSLTKLFSCPQLSRITFIWIFATAVTCITIPLFGVVESKVIYGGLFLMGFWLIWKSSKLLLIHCKEVPFQFTFKTINSYAVLVMVLLALDHLFH